VIADDEPIRIGVWNAEDADRVRNTIEQSRRSFDRVTTGGKNWTDS
jgi:hypothetical protein